MTMNGQLHAPVALPGANWVGEGEDARAQMDRMGKKKISAPNGNRTPVVHHVDHSTLTFYHEK